MIDLVLLISCCTGDICRHDGVPVDVSVNERAASSVVPVRSSLGREGLPRDGVCLPVARIEEVEGADVHVPWSRVPVWQYREKVKKIGRGPRKARGFGNGITVSDRLHRCKAVRKCLHAAIRVTVKWVNVRSSPRPFRWQRINQVSSFRRLRRHCVGTH